MRHVFLINNIINCCQLLTVCSISLFNNYFTDFKQELLIYQRNLYFYNSKLRNELRNNVFTKKTPTHIPKLKLGCSLADHRIGIVENSQK